MSQKSVLIALTIAIVLMMAIEAEAKRIGCAAFGHSCYGGHGKRSDPTITVQEIDAPDSQTVPLMRILQRRLPFPQEAPLNEVAAEREKELKLIVLGVLSDVVSEALKKATAPDQDVLV